MGVSAPKIKGINLVGIGGRFTRQIFPLSDRGASIGRESDNDLVLPGSSLSRRHAVIEQRDERWTLEDTSANGTWVNGTRVQEPVAIRHGDRIRFDRDEFLFVNVDEQSFDTRGYRLAEKETVTIGKLVFHRGDPEGEADELLLEESTITIGRDPTNDLVLEMPGVSGNHCKIRWVDDSFTLVDLKSTNGTYLDGSDERLDALELRHGTVFRVGSTPIRFETEEVTRPKASAPMPAMLFPTPSAADMLLPVVAAFLVVVALLFVLLVATGPAADPGSPVLIETEGGQS